MLKVILLSILAIALANATSTNSVNMRAYYESGSYELEPENYGYADNFIVSIWGAGSGASTYHNNGETYYCSGNSGGYIQLNITSNNDTFYFNLGKGGYSVLNNNYTYEYNYSEFYSDKLYIRIPSSSLPSEFSQPIQTWILNYTAADSILSIKNNTIYDCYEWDNVPNGGYGAYSPFGHEGGNYYSNPKCDGFMGSGAGYNCAYCKVDKHNSCIRPYKGGDGALILIY